MAPIKRKSQGKSSHTHCKKRVKSAPVLVPTLSTSTQTDAIKVNSLNNVPQARKMTRPRTAMKWEDQTSETSSMVVDKRNTRNKACQTMKMGILHMVSQSMDNLKATVLRRRKISVDADRSRLKKLMDEINSDPPPSWHLATQMWLEVDILDRRIEKIEREENEREEEEIET